MAVSTTAETLKTAEQEALSNILKSPEQGGAAVAGGKLGAGADVPAVLEADPALRQLLEESIATQTGKKSVVTSDTMADQVAKDQAKLEKITTPTEKKTTTETPATTDYSAEIDSTLSLMQAEYDNINTQLDNLSANADDFTQQYIDNIKASYASRMKQQEIINQATLSSQKLLGIRSGRQRYMTEIHTSILSAEESAGLQRLQALENEMNQLILEAQMANNAQDFETLNTKINLLSDINDKKLSALYQQQSMAIQQEQLLLQKAQDAREAQRFAREEQEATIDNITTTVFNSLTGDEETDMATVQNLADQYGVDANALLSSVQDYNLAFQEAAMTTASLYQSIAEGIPEGTTWTDPVSGMTFIGTEDPETVEVTQTIGNMEYKVQYKMIDGELQEQWRIALGPRWKGGSGSGGGSTTSTDAGDAMNETVAYLISTGLEGDALTAEIEWAAEQLSNEYGTDWGTTANTLESRVTRTTTSTAETPGAFSIQDAQGSFLGSIFGGGKQTQEFKYDASTGKYYASDNTSGENQIMTR